MINRDDVESFAGRIQQMVNDHFERSLKTLWDMGKVPTIQVSYGKKYAKIIKTEPGSTSVHSFVDMSNGDILKPATWSRPAKHARGNIYNEYQGMNSVGVYGANYL